MDSTLNRANSNRLIWKLIYVLIYVAISAALPWRLNRGERSVTDSDC